MGRTERQGRKRRAGFRRDDRAIIVLGPPPTEPWLIWTPLPLHPGGSPSQRALKEGGDSGGLSCLP